LHRFGDCRYACTITPARAGKRKRWLAAAHHQIPPAEHFRVKIWRRLQKLGAVAIKHSVYALPSNEPSAEDLNWVLREIVEGGGDALAGEHGWSEGLNDER